MVRLFRSKEEKELDAKLERVENNMSNNYKDAAQADYKEYLKLLDEVEKSGKLSGKKLEYYRNLTEEYSKKLANFTHKDQPTKWGDWEKPKNH